MKSRYALLLESNLLDHASGDDVTAEIAAVNHIKDGFKLLGYDEAHVPELDPRGSQTDYMWEGIVGLTTDVIWFETHGSSSQGVRPLVMEQIADVAEEDRASWGRMNARLIFFGSCYTGISRLISLLPRLVETTTVVVSSNQGISWQDGRHYPAFISQWGQVSAMEPEMQVLALNKVTPYLFQATIVHPDWSI